MELFKSSYCFKKAGVRPCFLYIFMVKIYIIGKKYMDNN